MANTISENFTDEELEVQLRSQFPYTEMWDVNFKVFFNQITDEQDYFQLRFRGRIFKINKQTGEVTEKGGDS